MNPKWCNFVDANISEINTSLERKEIFLWILNTIHFWLIKNRINFPAFANATRKIFIFVLKFFFTGGNLGIYNYTNEKELCLLASLIKKLVHYRIKSSFLEFAWIKNQDIISEIHVRLYAWWFTNAENFWRYVLFDTSAHYHFFYESGPFPWLIDS